MAYGYDGDGDQTAAGDATAAFDAAGRMSASTAAGVTTGYAYDGDGRRLSETTAAATTQFVWDPIGYQLLEERDGDGDLLRSYTYGNGLIDIGEPAAGGGPFYVHVDAQGSVLAVTDAAGTPQWRYAYQPYGALRTATQDDPDAPPVPVGYTGQYTDPATGTLLLRARSYDPGTGRFTTPDPAGTGDAYGYAADNPLVYTDPAGTDPGTGTGGYGPFSTGLTPDGDEIVQAESWMCDPSDTACRQQLDQSAALLYGGHQLAATVAGLSPVRCLSGKGSCPQAILDIALFTAGAADGEDDTLIALNTAKLTNTTDEAATSAGEIVGQLDRIEGHLARLDHSPANDAMIARIRDAAAMGRPLTEAEQNFMTHELTEAQLMDEGMGYDDAHEIAGATHPTFANYDPEVIKQFPQLFNSRWRNYWGIE